MRKLTWLGLVIVLVLPLGGLADGWRKDSSELVAINRRLAGTVVDFTANHGNDHRIWSNSLHQKRDLYVYLPPAYCKDAQYPIALFFHGFAQDEQIFLQVVAKIDEAIVQGKLPPLIIAVPDGSLPGEPCMIEPGSFFINSNAGNFEDFILHDVWDFVTAHYPVRPEREAHALVGCSMGGFATYNLGIRHRDKFGVVVGVFPPVNLRWIDDHGYYFANFDPEHWGWREHLDNPREVIGKYYGGLIKLYMKQFVEPLFGWGDQALVHIANGNPIELIDRTSLRPGELEMFIGYGGQDEFNVDAQVESFLYLAKARGLHVDVAYDPNGHHDIATAMKLLPYVFDWLSPRLAPYAPAQPVMARSGALANLRREK